MKIILDAFGGDNAPLEIIKGAALSIEEFGIDVILTGDEDIIRKTAQENAVSLEHMEIVHAPGVITMDDEASAAVKRKTDSSMTAGLALLAEGKGDAFVSAGNSGALVVGATLLVKRIKGVRRPGFAPVMPTETGCAMLIDCGANVECRPEMLLQFGQMGSIYMENVVGIKNPKVAIVNNGAEEEKGNALVKETFPLLKECKSINFIGSIEARDIPAGYADVVVCEAFVGNVILKLYEGVGSALVQKIKEGMMTSTRSKIGALLVKPALKETLKSFDATEYGGAPLLGLKGLVVKTHGSAKAIEIKHGIFQCVQFKQEKINEKIAERILEDQEVLKSGAE